MEAWQQVAALHRKRPFSSGKESRLHCVSLVCESCWNEPQNYPFSMPIVSIGCGIESLRRRYVDLRMCKCVLHHFQTGQRSQTQVKEHLWQPHCRCLCNQDCACWLPFACLVVSVKMVFWRNEHTNSGQRHMKGTDHLWLESHLIDCRCMQ